MVILCCGDTLIDMIPVESDQGTAYLPRPGGAIFNTAIALGRLGLPTQLFAGISTDFFGDLLRASLRESGVDASLLVPSDRPTTLAFVSLTDGVASYRFYDENSASRMLTPEQLPAPGPEVQAVMMGGISLCATPLADTLATFAQQQTGQRFLYLDPNIRPAFVDDEPAYRRRLGAMIEAASIVKVSEEDLAWLVPGAQGLEAKARALGSPDKPVIVTRGAEGASAFLAGEPEIAVPTPEVAMVDTIGAGDAFNAGFLAQVAAAGGTPAGESKALSRRAVAQALGFAVRVAAISTTRVGANPPWRRDLKALAMPTAVGR